MSKSFIFSSESVGEGHPDKVSDTISDAILDACLAIDKNSRVACETFVKSNQVVVGGEITIPKIGAKPIGEAINIEKVIREAIRGIGYTERPSMEKRLVFTLQIKIAAIFLKEEVSSLQKRIAERATE
ncbi:S-adenosylmethionine synthetase N-terminal domain-containing protein [Akkermansiaceae bacterium]|nr:S-adenosylmethionine synthetase N-terminal domain-containing protein [Akkermansiaceae bacterium]